MFVDGTPNLFPLTHLSMSLSGYYMDKDTNVWSAHRQGKLLKLTGSRAHSWSPRYYTLSGKSWNADDLVRRAKAHKAWPSETGFPVDVAVKDAVSQLKAKTATPIVDRDHAKNLSDGIAKKGFIIATIENGALSFGSNPAIHTTEKSVNSEIERLACLLPGTRFVKLQIQGAASLPRGVQWEV